MTWMGCLSAPIASIFEPLEAGGMYKATTLTYVTFMVDVGVALPNSAFSAVDAGSDWRPGPA